MNYVRAISKKYEKEGIPNFEQFLQEQLSKLNQGIKLNHAALITYIKYRDFLIDLFSKLLEKNKEGKYQPEKILHNILFPSGEESDDSIRDYDKHNLWIIDDRYSSYDYLASNKYEGSISKQGREPDDKRYDILATYSDPLGEAYNVFIVELKRTHEPLSVNNDPILQLKDYVHRIREGRINRHNGKRINITSNTCFYGFVICDIYDSYFKSRMIEDHSLIKKPDEKSFHTVLLNGRLFVEVTNYENILEVAKVRNQIFIKKLHMKHE